MPDVNRPMGVSSKRRADGGGDFEGYSGSRGEGSSTPIWDDSDFEGNSGSRGDDSSTPIRTAPISRAAPAAAATTVNAHLGCRDSDRVQSRA